MIIQENIFKLDISIKPEAGMMISFENCMVKYLFEPLHQSKYSQREKSIYLLYGY